MRWGLVITDVRDTDAGEYECQINTEPKMVQYITLTVRGKY